jgi:hypothetical protein
MAGPYGPKVINMVWEMADFLAWLNHVYTMAKISMCPSMLFFLYNNGGVASLFGSSRALLEELFSKFKAPFSF